MEAEGVAAEVAVAVAEEPVADAAARQPRIRSGREI